MTNPLVCLQEVFQLTESLFIVGFYVLMTGFVLFMGVYSTFRKGL
jgi:hypothetical protein